MVEIFFFSEAIDEMVWIGVFWSGESIYIYIHIDTHTSPACLLYAGTYICVTVSMYLRLVCIITSLCIYAFRCPYTFHVNRLGRIYVYGSTSTQLQPIQLA